MKKAIRNLIIRSDVYIESDNEFNQVMLSGQYALISILLILTYAVIDIFECIMVTSWFFGGASVIIAFTLVLHRKRLHCLANYILFPTFNLIVFLIASSENRITGSCLFFLPVALGSAAVFNYSQRKVAFAFAVLSFLLCAFAITTNSSILPFRNYSETDVQLIQTLNLIFVFPVSLLAVYLLIRLSHYNNKQLEKLNEELDRFVYSTSHDLRAPLLSVMGLLKLAESADQNEVKKYHQMMHDRVKNLDKFIKDITDYSRNNRLQVVQEPVPLALLANEIWESLRYSADAQEIQFINDIAEDVSVMNDGARLRVVLGNLIANSIRYHDHRKENRFIRVSHQLTATSFSVQVEDNGQGIAPELQTKIFEMFFRGNESSQGSGLGLYIVKETLAKLSATIGLASEPRQGSKFFITVPILFQ